MNTWRQASEYLRVRRAERQSLSWITRQQMELLKRCASRIAELEDDVQNLRRAVLSSHEDSLMLAEGWRMAKDLDDFDICDSLDVIITDLRDRMGQMQEFVT